MIWLDFLWNFVSKNVYFYIIYLISFKYYGKNNSHKTLPTCEGKVAPSLRCNNAHIVMLIVLIILLHTLCSKLHSSNAICLSWKSHDYHLLLMMLLLYLKSVGIIWHFIWLFWWIMEFRNFSWAVSNLRKIKSLSHGQAGCNFWLFVIFHNLKQIFVSIYVEWV